MNKYLNKLLDGNKRFIEENLSHPNTSINSVKSFSKKQNPFAIVISCSDSRVPVEIVFDVGISDIFVVRTAGHVLDDISIASIEYALENLDIKLILVLGHHNCGAVKSTINKPDDCTKSIKKMMKKIEPAVERAKKEADNNEELLNLSVKYNVIETVNNIKKLKPIISKLITKNNIYVVGAEYDINTGKVEVIES